MGWMYSFNRKKQQRNMNKYVRAINKNLENDGLWRGRFYVRQVDSPVFYVYEDKSGASLEHIHLVLTDRVTGQTVDGWDNMNGWCHWNGSRLWRFVNDAIVEKLDIWRNGPNPYEIKNDPKYDYRRKK